MGTVTLDYGKMSQAETNARNIALQCERYTEKIHNKVTQKLESLERGSSNMTVNANYYARQKIRELDRRREDSLRFANKVKSAKEYAEQTDRKIASYIQKESSIFRKNHNMEVSLLEEWFCAITTNLLNKTEFGRWISNLFKKAEAWLDKKKREFKNWYYNEGGKYIIKTVLTVVATIVAVAVLFCVALPALVTAVTGVVTALGAMAAGAGIAGLGTAVWTMITASAAFVTATMSVINGMVKIKANTEAYLHNEDDPGWAKRYEGYSSFSDFLRKEMFADSWQNEMSYLAADAYDRTAFVAECINIADMGKSGISFAKKIKAEGIGHIFNKVHFKSPNGKMTWGTFKHGLKQLNENRKIWNTNWHNTNISRINKTYKEGKFVKQVLNIQKVTKGVEKVKKGYEAYTLSLIHI